MLRIDTISQTRQQVVLKLEGRLAGADVDLLDQIVTRWLELIDHLTLDLKGVKFIDRAGIELLRNWTRLPLLQGNGTDVRLSLRDGSRFIRTLLESNGIRVI